jgi:hypothetical protein
MRVAIPSPADRLGLRCIRMAAQRASWRILSIQLIRKLTNFGPLCKDEEINRILNENMDAEKLDKVIIELEKMENKGIGNALLKELKTKRMQLRKDPLDKIDPRSASRTPNAAREPWRPTRYDCPVEASPSRMDPVYIPPEVLDNSNLFQRNPQVGPRSSTGSISNRTPHDHRNVVINMPIPRPGYTLAGSSAKTSNGGASLGSR